MGCSDPPSRKTSCAAIRSIVCKWSPAVIFCRFCFSCRESPPLCTPWDSPHLVTECDKCYRVSNISIQIRQLLWVIFMTKIPTGFWMGLCWSCIKVPLLLCSISTSFPFFLQVLIHNKHPELILSSISESSSREFNLWYHHRKILWKGVWVFLNYQLLPLDLLGTM